jgi:hypothetical protein
MESDLLYNPSDQNIDRTAFQCHPLVPQRPMLAITLPWPF